MTKGSASPRRDFLRRMVGAAGVPLLARSAGAAATTRRRPNVIIVLTDDQGYGDLSCHGNPVLKTPNIDRLHQQSIRFTDFHVSPMCTPTRSQIMTGRDTLANRACRVCSGESFVRRDVPTMANLFSAGGYRTGIFGKWHLGDNYPHRPEDRGFQEAVHHKGWGVSSVADYWNNDCFNDTYCHNGVLQQYEGYCTDVWFREATRWIEECHRRREPFLAYLATNAPHGPHFVPDQYRDPYRKQGLPLDLASFFGMIANIDENVGGLDAMLARTGLRDDTILIFMTDNGGTAGVNLYNAGMRGRKEDLWEGGHRVPCFIRWPGGRLRAPGDVDTLAECQDLLPTLLELCGVKSRAQFDGSSLAPLLRQKEAADFARRMLVVQYCRQPVPQLVPPAKWDSTVMWNRWRLVAGKELYNLETDPGQKSDVAAGNGEIVRKLRDRYEGWWTRVEPSLAHLIPISVGSDREKVTCLNAHDWVAPNTANPADIRLGVKHNGPWHIQVERAGEYEISLRRWPEEANTAITAGLPAHHPEDESFPAYFPAGKPLPIARARLKIGASDETRPVEKHERAAAFRVKLPAGETQAQTWFYDSNDQELCGAYYTYVRLRQS